jgi:uncharacterized protein YxeA
MNKKIVSIIIITIVILITLIISGIFWLKNIKISEITEFSKFNLDYKPLSGDIAIKQIKSEYKSKDNIVQNI